MAKKLVTKDERFYLDGDYLCQEEPESNKPGAKQQYSNVNMKMKVARR